MRTIVYKIRLERYEIAKISEGCEDEITLQLEEPLDGNILIEKSAFPLKRGIAKIPADQLSEGEVSPKISTSSGTKRLEGFIFKRGAVIRKHPDADYVRSLAEATDSLLKKVSALEAEIEEIKNKISPKIHF